MGRNPLIWVVVAIGILWMVARPKRTAVAAPALPSGGGATTGAGGIWGQVIDGGVHIFDTIFPGGDDEAPAVNDASGF